MAEHSVVGCWHGSAFQGDKCPCKKFSSGVERDSMKAARKRIKMRQIDMARQLGITESLVTKIETGRCDPEPRIKVAIAKMLGIHTWEVL